MNISVYYCFPRSGGTLLNQCLLCHDQNVVLSEVNPAGSVIHPAQQAADWFDLIPDKATLEGLTKLPYLEVIAKIAEFSHRAGKTLCLRDWSGPNFFAGLSPWLDEPSLRLEQRLYLDHTLEARKEIVFLRRSRAVFASIKTHVPECAELSMEHFSSVYRLFLRQTHDLPRFFFEDFVRDSATQLEMICKALGMAHAPDFSDRFSGESRVTGNTPLPRPTASATWTEIRVPPSPRNEIPESPLFRELDLLAGYAD